MMIAIIIILSTENVAILVLPDTMAKMLNQSISSICESMRYCFDCCFC